MQQLFGHKRFNFYLSFTGLQSIYRSTRYRLRKIPPAREPIFDADIGPAIGPNKLTRQLNYPFDKLQSAVGPALCKKAT